MIMISSLICYKWSTIITKKYNRERVGKIYHKAKTTGSEIIFVAQSITICSIIRVDTVCVCNNFLNNLSVYCQHLSLLSKMYLREGCSFDVQITV